MNYTNLTRAVEATLRNMSPERHARYRLAVDEDGNCCHPEDPAARRWCVAGRLMLELHREGFSFKEVDAVFLRALPSLGFHASVLSKANDKQGLPAAKHLLAQVLKLAKERGDDALPAED